jgi:type II secretory pathway pseudopilin PulG
MRYLRGLSLIELVLALGLIFISAGGVMSVIVAGVSWPKRTQFSTVRDSLAKGKLDELMVSSIPPLPSPVFAPVTGFPDYDMQILLHAVPYDPAAQVVQVSVRGPRPQLVTSTILGLFVPSDGAVAFEQYGCSTCHALGANPPVPGAPNLGQASLTAATNARNLAYDPDVSSVNAYVSESVRQPDRFTMGEPVVMTAYPDIIGMPQEDLNAITTYLLSIP